MNRAAVETSPDFRRIAAMPRRTWTKTEAEELAELMTAELATRYCKYALRPIQAMMIAEAVDVGGLFAACGVGSGKTLPSMLIPTMMEAERPLLLIQANLYEKTQRDLAYWAYHFRVHPRIKVMTYERLSIDYAGGLDAYQPDLIIADEGQRLKNRGSARGRKFLRYMQEHQDTKFVYLGGSPLRSSLVDLWHLVGLALAKGNAPLPYTLSELETWASAVDPKLDEDLRLAPGVLLQLAEPEDAANDDCKPVDSLTVAWRGLRRRMVQTRGFVATKEDSAPQPLVLSEIKIDVPKPIQDALRSLRTTWTTPNGDELTQAIDVWRHARELACGFWYRWLPAPPERWLLARKAWAKFVRTVLSHNREGLDSPKQVALRYQDQAVYKAWAAVRHLYDPNKHKVAQWVDDFLLRDAAEWLGKEPGIAWVEHNTVGERLSALTGFPYYGGGDEASAAILDAKGPIIASIAAHGTGKNLQHYARSLILSFPPSATTIEQLLGRTHRQGQTADEVTGEFYMHCLEVQDGFEKALIEARFIQESTGMPQKLLAATRTFGAVAVNEDRETFGQVAFK